MASEKLDEKLDEKTIFNVARKMDSPDARAKYLHQFCGTDENLFERVNVLLRAYEEQASFLETPHAIGGPPTFDQPTLDQPIIERPGMQIGPYKLMQEIGEGGMGVVYMAEQNEPVKRRVALKIIKPGMDTRQVIARFEAEEQALAIMDHPNIAKVHDAGTTDSGRPYFVMELVNGIPVTQYCDEQHLTARERLELFIPICQAVQHAHQKGIIHRDIKPTNILVALYDGRPVPKVIDFGVAKATGAQLTNKTMFTGLGQIVGTIEYMSPEQANRNQLDIDTRSDVYSLGVVLYELLTGDTPFDKKRLRSAAIDELLRIIWEEEPPMPSTKLSSSDTLPSVATNRHTALAKLSALVRGELDWIVMKALEKDRARRYETANGFANDIKRYLDNEAVQACPPSARYRFDKFARRNKVAIATTTAIATALLIGTGIATWQAVRAIQARDEASRAAVAERQAHEEADQAWAAERRKRAEALLDKTRSERWSRQIGRRFVGLAAIDEAADIIRTLEGNIDSFDPRFVAQRSEAIACLGLADFRVLENYSNESSPAVTRISPESGRWMVRVGDRSIALHVGDQLQETLELKISKSVIPDYGLIFSPDGRLVAASYDGETCGTRVWNCETGRVVVDETFSVIPNAIHFSRDSRRFAAVDPSGTVRLWQLDSKTAPLSFSGLTEPCDFTFSPNGEQMAVINESSEILILDIKRGSPVRRFKVRAKIWDENRPKNPAPRPTCIDWGPDGKYLAMGGSAGVMQLIDAATGEWRADLTGHKHTIDRIAFHPGGEYLATSAWDGTTRLWNIATKEEVLRAPGLMMGFNRTGKRLAFVRTTEVGIWEVNLARECRYLSGHTPGTTVLGSAFSPNGQLLATWGYDGVRIWEPHECREIGFLDLELTRSVVFDPLGSRLFTCSSRGLLEWPLQQATSNGITHVQLGPARRVVEAGVPWQIVVPSCGSTIAYIVNIEGDAAILDLDKRTVTPVQRDGDLSQLAISPNGRWLAGPPQQSSGVFVWETTTGRVLKQLPSHGWSGAAFSPNDDWLVTSDLRKVCFWRTSDWALSHVIDSPGVGCVTFSPDGSMLATGKLTATDEPNAVLLFETTTGRLLARLESTPAPTQIERLLAFSPDGRFLVVPHYNDGVFCMWDLRLIRQRLRSMELDWDPPLPMAPSHPSPALRLEIDWGELSGALQIESSTVHQRPALRETSTAPKGRPQQLHMTTSGRRDDQRIGIKRTGR